jgi:hypothetical protein
MPRDVRVTARSLTLWMLGGVTEWKESRRPRRGLLGMAAAAAAAAQVSGGTAGR